MDGGRPEEADREFQDLVDQALEKGFAIGRVFEQARVMFFLLKIEDRGALAARLAKHLDSQPTRPESEAVHGAVADAFGEQPECDIDQRPRRRTTLVRADLERNLES